ncbi:uncharacterized protein LOC132706618 isoform X6 [Cylas formicarius]|uniref:uncharacterized protein LOC132706618 isoform X6 n=1 Tax=Cylas formicarius TaxID=197179 RepID=UPI0029585CDE|nr:uncharacterized protein LOC132706618 isoform X6 [Cylas formicarius]
MMSFSVKSKPILIHARFCMTLAGIWPLAIPTKRLILLRAYAVYSDMVKIYFPMFLVSLCMEFTLSTVSNNNVEKKFSQLIYVISLLIVGVAATLYQGKDFKEIITYIIKDEKDIRYSVDVEIKRCHLGRVRFCSKACWAITIMTCGVGISICLENFWRRFEVDQYNKHQNVSMEKPFAYDLYYYHLDKETHAGVLLILNDFSVRLQIRFERWKGDGDCFSETLKDLVLQHQNVIRFITKLNGSIKYLIFMEFLLNSLNIAAVSIQFITFEKTMLASPILFFGILFTQTFVLGWSANEIKVQSLMLADALYRSPWYEQNETVKKMVLTMIMRAQTPLVLTIGPFDAMTTQSALAIMKGSYSYVSVMLNNYQ